MSALLKPDETLTLGLNVIIRQGHIKWGWHDGKYDAYHAPQDWAQYDKPCEHPYTNEATGKCVWDGVIDDAALGFIPCRDGRRIVPLYRECRQCNGGGEVIGRPPPDYADIRRRLPCPTCSKDGRVLVGRAAVVSIEPEDDGRNFRITLDVVELS